MCQHYRRLVSKEDNSENYKYYMSSSNELYEDVALNNFEVVSGVYSKL